MKFIYTIVLLLTFQITYAQSVQLVRELGEGTNGGVVVSANIISNVGSSIVFLNRANGTNQIYFTQGQSFNTSSEYDLGADGEVVDYEKVNEYLYISVYNSVSASISLLRFTESGQFDVVVDDWEVIDNLQSYNNKLYFEGESDIFNTALYSLNSETFAPEKIFNIHFFGMQDMVEFQGSLYILTRLDSGLHLVKSNGTTGDMEIVYFLHDSSEFTSANNMTVTEDKIFFWTTDTDVSYALYVSDGTPSGTNRLSTAFEEISFYDYKDKKAFIGHQGKIYFRGQLEDGPSNAAELYVSNGTVEGTRKIEVIEGTRSKPEYFVEYQNQIYVKVFKSFFFPNQAMYVINENDEAFPALDNSIIGGSYNLDGFHLTQHDDLLFFGANNIDNGFEVWKSDGSESNTQMIEDINVGEDDSNPTQLTSAETNIFFFAQEPNSGRELYVYSPLDVSSDQLSILDIELSVSPNPASDRIRVGLNNYENLKTKYYIISGDGSIIKSGSLLSNEMTLDISNLSGGIYYLSLQGYNGAMKFIKG